MKTENLKKLAAAIIATADADRSGRVIERIRDNAANLSVNVPTPGTDAAERDRYRQKRALLISTFAGSAGVDDIPPDEVRAMMEMPDYDPSKNRGIAKLADEILLQIGMAGKMK